MVVLWRCRHSLVGSCVGAVAAAFAVSGILAPRHAEAQPLRREFTELHLGVAVRVVLYAPDDADARSAARAAFERIAALEDIMSDYRPASEVRRLVAAPPGQRVALSPELCTVLGAALEMARATDGAYDPTVGPLVELWRTARRTGRLPSERELSLSRAKVGWRRVQLDTAACAATIDVPGVQLDLGGIAKGFILDEALAVLAAHGIARALLEAGGDIVVGAPPPGKPGWRVGVPHADPVLVSRAAAISHAAISTSGDTEQFIEIGGERYSHIVDPRTGLGATSGALVTVIAPRGIIADALATALAVMGAGEGDGLLRGYPEVIGVRASERKTK